MNTKAMSSTVNVGSGHAAPSAPDQGTAPHSGMGSIKGFGSGSAHASTQSGAAGTAPQTGGVKTARGFGSGLMPGKV